MSSGVASSHSFVIFFHPALVGTFTSTSAAAVVERKVRRSAFLYCRGSMHRVSLCSVPLAVTA